MVSNCANNTNGQVNSWCGRYFIQKQFSLKNFQSRFVQYFVMYCQLSYIETIGKEVVFAVIIYAQTQGCRLIYYEKFKDFSYLVMMRWELYLSVCWTKNLKNWRNVSLVILYCILYGLSTYLIEWYSAMERLILSKSFEYS